MNLPKFFRQLGWVMLWVFLGTIPAFIVVALALGNSPGLQAVLFEVLGAVFVVGALVSGLSWLLDPLSREVGNAVLRRFGRPATATLEDRYNVSNGTRRGVKSYISTRFKLRVQPADGEPFIGVAEDSLDVGFEVTAGGEYPVKYDPLTKAVAFALPKVARSKPIKRDF